YLIVFILRSHFLLVFFLLILPPPRSTLFPYTTLFRSYYWGPGFSFFFFNDGFHRRFFDGHFRGGRGFFDGRGFVGNRGFAGGRGDRKSTRLNSSHRTISYAVFCLKKKKKRK